MSPGAVADVTRMLAGRTGTEPDEWHLVHKARYGALTVLSALARSRGYGEVATQLFTCSTAVDPILVAGLRPVFAEVSPRSVAIDPDRLTVGWQTRAIMLQHTFGIIDTDGSGRLRELADDCGALLVEDSAHCLGRLARDADGAPVADVSVHSFGVEKMLPTKFGGAVWVNPRGSDPELAGRIAADLAALPVAGGRLDLAARLYRTENRVLHRLPAVLSRPTRAALTATGLLDPPIAPVECRGGLPHAAMRPSAWMVEQMAAALPGLVAVEARRSAAVAAYLEAFAGLAEPTGAIEVPAVIGPDAPLVRFPFFATGTDAAERVIAAVSAAGFYAGRWYRPGLFPGAPDPTAYGYRPGAGDLATTEDLVARVVNLPTTVDPAQAARVVDVVADVIG